MNHVVERLLPGALALACASLALPLLRHPRNWGRGDWDLYLQWYEAIRRTILEWHQVPWWNPWCRGGFPLAGEPQCGLAAIDTPLVLLFGASVGLRLATVLYFWLAVEGARRLALLWLRCPWGAALAGVLYGVSGCAVVYAAGGHGITMSYLFLPWMAYYAFRLERRPADAAWLGFWSALAVLTAVQYATAFAFLLAFLVWLRGVAVHRGPGRRRLLVHTVLALGVFLLLAGPRLAVTGSVLMDYPRALLSHVHRSPLRMLGALVARPAPPFLLDVEAEQACYVGIVPVLLALASLRHGWRWWHTVTLLGFWMALGSAQWYEPSYWVRGWPGFATMHMVQKWRILALLGVALAAASELAAWRRAGTRRAHGAAVVLVLFVAADLFGYAHRVLPVAFGLEPDERLYPGPPARELVNIEAWETEQPGYGRYGQTLAFPCIRRGYGVIRGFEPQLGYDRSGPTARLWRGHPDYVGEHWTDEGAVVPVSWSPNRIVFRVAPHQAVHVNQNPGSWWLVNGVRLDASLRCAEPLREFVVRGDANGDVDLRIWPRGLGLGVALSGFGAVLIGVFVVGKVAAPDRTSRSARVSDPAVAPTGGLLARR